MPTRLHRAARRATRTLGVRGSGLMLIAAIWTLMGVGTLTRPDGATPPGTFHGMIPAELWATVWLTGATLALTASLDRRYGSHRDGLGLAVATVPPMLLASSYLWAWVVDLVPGPPPGLGRGWLTAAIYLCMVALVWLVAAIPDMPEGKSDPTPT